MINKALKTILIYLLFITTISCEKSKESKDFSNLKLTAEFIWLEENPEGKVRIEGGEVFMGINDMESYPDERPTV